jgi:ATP-dependent Clp protease ATP-binding subunit ClpA
MMFSTELGFTLEAAFREASSRRHAYFTLEHLLYALVFEPSIVEILNACRVDITALRHNLEDFFDVDMEVSSEANSEPIQTPAIRRVLERSVMKTQSSGKSVVTPQDVFVAMLDEDETHAVYFLGQQSLKKIDVLDYLSHGVVKPGVGAGFDGEDEPEEIPRGRELEKFTENLTERARQGLFDPVIGRSDEILRALHILSRRYKNNPLIIGEPGVGKTAIAYAIAQRLVSGELPPTLYNLPMFSLNLGALLAGTKFRGDLEERFKSLLSELKKLENSILLIDEIHTILGSGSTSGSSLDAAALLKPALTEGWLRCIGITTHEDYKKNFKRDKAFSRRFSVIEVDEPSIDETLQILTGLKGKFEEHHGVVYTKTALAAAVELSDKYLNDRRLPDKALDVIDEAGARNALLSKSKQKKTISGKDIERVVSIMAKVPVSRNTQSDTTLLRDLHQRLSSNVFGQDEAVSAIVRAIKRSRAQLKPAGMPVGSFLFAGPTGVGKTELSKTLARELGIHFHRFDMSEFMEKHAVSRLLGAPPGYVGHEDGGVLVDKVRQHPHAVLLFDEIEKAHEDVYNVLLQIMDDAVVTDSQGRQADFRNIIIILTTNAGSEQAGSFGFGEATRNTAKEDAIKRLFRPEFRNRLDEIVYFNPLPPDIIESVASKFLRELGFQLAAQGVIMEVSEAAKQHVAKKGFDALLGARPMRRYIQSAIKDKIIDALLFGELSKGGRLYVNLQGDSLEFKFEQLESPKQIAPAEV